MTVTLRTLPLKLAVAALSFAAVLFALRALDGSTLQQSGRAGGSVQIAPDATTDEQIEALRPQIESRPADPKLRTELGLAYLKKAGEVADSTYYLRSGRALAAALRIDPSNFDATGAMGKLALAKHHFHQGLTLGVRAQQIHPGIAATYGLITDGQVELGRYAQAHRTLQRWVDLKPGLPSYARVSYFRELHGDLAGAVEAMRLAAAAGTSTEFSYVESLLGKLDFDRGAYVAAERDYRKALGADPGYPTALAGLGSVEAAAGHYGRALSHYRAAERALPSADFPVAIGEIHQAAGHRAAATEAYARGEARIRAERRNGVHVEAELALFEAEHGDPKQAVALARQAWAIRPSVTTADTYSWALHQAGRPAAALGRSRQAMRLGSRDPLFLYHAGVIAAAAGRPAMARTLLTRLIEQSPRFHPLYAPRAKRALRSLGTE
jgi:tetratricopeptide (TPR) repeat protein